MARPKGFVTARPEPDDSKLRISLSAWKKALKEHKSGTPLIKTEKGDKPVGDQTLFCYLQLKEDPTLTLKEIDAAWQTVDKEAAAITGAAYGKGRRAVGLSVAYKKKPKKVPGESIAPTISIPASASASMRSIADAYSLALVVKETLLQISSKLEGVSQKDMDTFSTFYPESASLLKILRAGSSSSEPWEEEGR